MLRQRNGLRHTHRGLSLHHAKSLIRYLQDAHLCVGRLAELADDFPDRLADDARPLVRQRLHGAHVPEQVALFLHLLRRRVEVVVLQVDDVRGGEDALPAGPQVDALAPQVVRLLLHVDRVADLHVDLVVVPRDELVQSSVGRLEHLQLAVGHSAERRRERRLRGGRRGVLRRQTLEVRGRVGGAVAAVDVAEALQPIRVRTRVLVEQIAALPRQQRALGN